MKNIELRLIPELQKGNCVPSIIKLAKKLKEPSSTLHFNLRKMENENKILAYKAVFDYNKINKGFCGIVLITLSPEVYGKPELVAREIAKHPEVESVDILTGDWELIAKIRAKDQVEYYELIKRILSNKYILKTKTLVSLRQVKSEYVLVEK